MSRALLRTCGGGEQARRLHARMPREIEPMLATLGADLPKDESGWGFEYKWDGVRAMTYWDGSRLRILSRNQNEITARYPELAELGKALGKRQVILDGEILALDDAGKPSFSRLQQRMHLTNTRALPRVMRDVPIWYLIFDLLWLDGESLMSASYLERHEKLEELTVVGPCWQRSPMYTTDGKALMEAARRNGLEGIVAKKLESTYEPGKRSMDWVKLKVVCSQEFVIGGWVPERTGRASRVGAVLLGVPVGGNGKSMKLQYVGKVGSGFSDETQEILYGALSKVSSEASPFTDEKTGQRDARWVNPKLVAEIEFRGWTGDQKLRQGAFKGLRDDKRAEEIGLEQAKEEGPYQCTEPFDLRVKQAKAVGKKKTSR